VTWAGRISGTLWFLFTTSVRLKQTHRWRLFAARIIKGRGQRQTRKQLVATTSRTKWVHTCESTPKDTGPANQLENGKCEKRAGSCGRKWAWKCERTPGSDYKLFILFAEQVKSFHSARDICSGPLGGDETSWNLRKKFDFINKPLGK